MERSGLLPSTGQSSKPMALLWLLVLFPVLSLPALAVILFRYCDVVGTRSFALQFAALVLAAMGAVPPSLLTLLWYARSTEPIWAMSGPGPFGFLGGGPALLWGFILTADATIACWLTAIWLSVQAQRAA
jgi:hypothetical protein